MANKAPKSLREILLSHQLIFISLIVLSVVFGVYGISIWEKASKESERINTLIQEIHLVRGDIYRQMKELFDQFFLDEQSALSEYQNYTQSALRHFEKLNRIAHDEEEKKAIAEMERLYGIFVNEAPSLFYRYEAKPDRENQKSLYQDIENGIFSQYEQVSEHAEQLLKVKQIELKHRLNEAKILGIVVLSIPLFLAVLLLQLSRIFLKKSIVTPIQSISQGAAEISAGNLAYKVPETGALELATLSTEINKMADDLAESRQALVKSEKQAALGLLVPMLAHNIRNPLASIRATAQVADNADLDSDTRESLSGIMATVDRLERWTSVLLAYLNPIKPQLDQANLGSIIVTVTDLLEEKRAQKQIKLQYQAPDNPQLIHTDEHLLEQMLYNLTLNAIEASPTGGEIGIKTALSNKQVAITISDNGAGMPFKPEANAVSPGPSTKRFGTGLGIPFAFKVCEVLNGNITFSNANPSGTIVHITLPQ